MSNFNAARDLAAWIGLTPKPHSSGGKEKLGKTTKMGNCYLRRMLYLGALAQIPVRMARTVWAALKTGQSYRAMPG